MKTLTQKTWQARDLKNSWHPFTQMQDWAHDPMLVIEEARAERLKDTEGNWYIDGVSSLWVTVHGHRKTEIDEAIKKQLDRVAHTTFLGLSHTSAIELTEKLIHIVPKGLKRVFYSDSGSEAVEIALKMSYQYWQQARPAKPKKTAFVRFVNDYHGDTVGAMSVGGIDLFFAKFRHLFSKTFLVRNLKELEHVIKKNHASIAAIVVEPEVQAAAGMLLHPQGFLKSARTLTEKYNIHLICDEVATGFGRTGKMFACEHERVTPDFLTLGKGLTGGYLPLAATVTTEKIYKAFLGKYEDLKTFFHGHTYTANPLACAAAIASLDLFDSEKTLTHLQEKIKLLTKSLQKFKTLRHVKEIRQKGFMMGIELVKDKKTGKPYALKDKIGIRVCQHIRAKGVILRPLGSVIILMPPLSIDLDTLSELVEKTYEAIEEVTSAAGHPERQSTRRTPSKDLK